eukprot:3602046-Rhodomonas_salina.1
MCIRDSARCLHLSLAPGSVGTEFGALAQDIVFMAGERVLRDAIVVPFSRGCNLLTGVHTRLQACTPVPACVGRGVQACGTDRRRSVQSSGPVSAYEREREAVYSKKHIDSEPELKPAKMQHNQ